MKYKEVTIPQTEPEHTDTAQEKEAQRLQRMRRNSHVGLKEQSINQLDVQTDSQNQFDRVAWTNKSSRGINALPGRQTFKRHASLDKGTHRHCPWTNLWDDTFAFIIAKKRRCR